MSELARYATEHLLSLEHPVRSLAIGAAVGTAALGGAGINVSLWLHRVKHGGVILHEGAKRVFRKTNFFLTGMSNFDWNTHLAHPHGDGEGEDNFVEMCDSWNAGRPEGAPEAGVAVFRNPYSVVFENEGGITTLEQLRMANEGEDLGDILEGGLKNGYRRVFSDTPSMHGKAKKVINPFVYALAEFDNRTGRTDREHWPAHLRSIDIEEGNPKAIRNKYSWLGLVSLGVTEAAVLGAPATAVAMGIHVFGLLRIGGFINSPAHFGAGKGFRDRYAVWSGKKLPRFNENGDLATSILPRFSLLFMGENIHDQHHAHPEYPYLAGSKLRTEIPGWIIYQLQKHGWAITPGAPNGPHDRMIKPPKPRAQMSSRELRREAKILARRESIRRIA